HPGRERHSQCCSRGMAAGRGSTESWRRRWARRGCRWWGWIRSSTSGRRRRRSRRRATSRGSSGTTRRRGGGGRRGWGGSRGGRGREAVVVVGYSRGADVLPATVNRLDPDARARVRLLGQVAAEKLAEFEVHVTDFVTSGEDGAPIEPEVRKLGGTPLVCIFG